MLQKYDRNYKILIQKLDGEILTVSRPFTLEFEISRNSYASANDATFRIFNLAPNNRSQIRKNYYDWAGGRLVSFNAGYGTNLAIAFQGTMVEAWSVREGTDFISTIVAKDGGFAFQTAITNQSFVGGGPSATPASSILKSIIGDLSGVQVGAIGNFNGQISRGNAYSGATTSILSELTGDGFFIDNNKANCLNDNEVIQTPEFIVSPKSGLLGTPVRQETVITLEMLFEPGLKIGQQITLQSATTSDSINGQYKLIALRHKGTISDAVCGSATSELTLQPGPLFVPIPVQPDTTPNNSQEG